MPIKKRYLTGIFAIVILAALDIFMFVGLDNIVNEVVLQKVWLDPEKVEMWGQNPGHSKTVTLRNYTFYNFTNPREFLYHNATPRFH